MRCPHVEPLQGSGVHHFRVLEFDEGKDDGPSGPALRRHLPILLGRVELGREEGTVPAKLCMEDVERTRVKLAE